MAFFAEERFPAATLAICEITSPKVLLTSSSFSDAAERRPRARFGAGLTLSSSAVSFFAARVARGFLASASFSELLAVDFFVFFSGALSTSGVSEGSAVSAGADGSKEIVVSSASVSTDSEVVAESEADVSETCSTEV